MVGLLGFDWEGVDVECDRVLLCMSLSELGIEVDVDAELLEGEMPSGARLVAASDCAAVSPAPGLVREGPGD
jgi:hypothetical protein